MAAVSQVSNWADTTIIFYISSMLNGEPTELENCVFYHQSEREGGRGQLRSSCLTLLVFTGGGGRGALICASNGNDTEILGQNCFVRRFSSVHGNSASEYQVELRLCNET